MVETAGVPATPGGWRHHLAQARLVGAISRLTWREVESHDVSPTATGPIILVANHFGGAADAIVLMSVLPRRPRILADDTIWRFPVARQVMEWIGAIPVHRGRTATGGASHSGQDNTDMFASTHDALADGELVLIFPEGITREEPSIGRVRSGAARIALGARAKGVRGIRIVPVGIHYDDKAAFRSSVYVREGEPIDLDAVVSGTDHETVEGLTALVEERLRGAAPDYDDWREARALQIAAESYLRDLEPTRSVPIGLRDRLGGWLARRDDHEELENAADHYRRELDASGLTDSWATEGIGGLRSRSIRTVLTFLVMLPYALGGIVMHGVPLVLSWLVSKIRMGPAMMATIMPVATALLFGLNMIVWLFVGWAWDAWVGVFVLAVTGPVTFAALVSVSERAQLWRRGLTNRLVSIGGNGVELLELRASVVALVDTRVDDALGGS